MFRRTSSGAFHKEMLTWVSNQGGEMTACLLLHGTSEWYSPGGPSVGGSSEWFMECRPNARVNSLNPVFRSCARKSKLFHRNVEEYRK